jgi:hypothetical protein
MLRSLRARLNRRPLGGVKIKVNIDELIELYEIALLKKFYTIGR